MKPAIAIALSLAALTVAGMAAQARPPLTLEMLMMPADKLPEGCALRQVLPQPMNVPMRGQSRSLPRNPWIGSDRDRVASIRGNVLGGTQMRPLPDAPPITPEQSAAIRAKAIEHIVDAYWAGYSTPQNDTVDVYAIRFDDPALATGTPVAPPFSTTAERFARGPIVVAIAASAPSRCFDAVKNYLQALY